MCTSTICPPVELNDVDHRIWTEELDQFIPDRIFDVHTHCYRWEFNTDPAKETTAYASLIGQGFRVAGRTNLDAWDAALLPGRQVRRLSFGFPFVPACDFEVSNRFVAQQASQVPGSGALMLVHPSMSAHYLEEQIRTQGFLGFKPYYFYARPGDAVQCRNVDFLPVEQIEVAHQHGLIVMLHLARRDAIADQTNIDDLLRLTSEYGHAKWILAHCGRSYSAWAIERAAGQLRGLPNVWYDTSSVCESDAIGALMAGVGPERVMYGSDDLPIGAARGKYLTFGYAWAFLSETNHSLNLSHCDPQMTFVRYEQLRAMRRAALQLGLTRAQIEDIFCNTASQLVQSVQTAQQR
jgi:predicted TIM-barrel fold metal-dependent hydrolase